MIVLAGFLAIFIGMAVGLLGGGGSILTTPLLEGTVLRFVGRISYALYLWHYPVLLLAGGLHGGLSAVPWLLLSVALATASTLLVEEPVRQWWRSRGRTGAGRWSPIAGTLVPTSPVFLPDDRGR